MVAWTQLGAGVWIDLRLHVIPQHRLLGIRMDVHLLRYPRCARYKHPVGHRIAVQVMLEQCQGQDQRDRPLSVVLDETQELLLVVARQVGYQEPHQVLEDVDVLPPRARHRGALHQLGPVLGRQFVPVPLARVGDEAAYLGLMA